MSYTPIINFNFDEWESKSHAISFYTGYFLSMLSSSSGRVEFQQLKSEVGLKDTFDLIKNSCQKFGINYDLLLDFELGKSTDGKDLGSYYPIGILELCFLLNQTKIRSNKSQLIFLILGKAISYFARNEINNGELSFLVNSIPLGLLREHDNELQKLFRHFLNGEKLEFVLKILSSTFKVDRRLTSVLIDFPLAQNLDFIEE